MYKVIKRFHDLQDPVKIKDGTVYFGYNVGDVFPRKGKEVSEDRIAELAGESNRQGVPLIALAGEDEEPNMPSKKRGARNSAKKPDKQPDSESGEQAVTE